VYLIYVVKLGTAGFVKLNLLLEKNLNIVILGCRVDKF